MRINTEKETLGIFQEKEEQKEKKFSRVEQRKIESWRQRLESLARTVAEDKTLKISVGKSGGGWAYALDGSREVFFDPQEALDREGEQEGVLLGSIAHEAGHALISDWSFIPDSIRREIGFDSTLRAVEERPTDQIARERLGEASHWVDEMRSALTRESGPRGLALERLGYVPQFVEVDNLIVFDPVYTDEQREEIPERAREAYEAIRGEVERMEHTYPEKGASKKEKLRLAKERYKTTYKTIWSEIKDLALEDRENAIVRQTALYLLEQNAHWDEEKMGGPSPLSELSPEEQSELVETILPPWKKRVTELVSEHAEGMEGALPNVKDTDTLERKLEALDAMTANDFGYKSMPVPMDKLSDELKKRLKEIYESLEKQAQEMLKNLSEEDLKKLEEMIGKMLQGMMVENGIPAPPPQNPESPPPSGKPGSGEDKKKEQERIQELEREIKERQEALVQKTVYDEYYNEVQPIEEKLYADLYDLFYPRKSKKTRLKSSGSKVNARALFNFISARKAGAKDVPANIWETKERPTVNDFKFKICVDLSGSMLGTDGDRIKETLKAIIAITEALERLGVKIEIEGFGKLTEKPWNELSREQQNESYNEPDKLIMLKPFDEKLSDDHRQNLTTILNVDGSTPTSMALQKAREQLSEDDTKHTHIIVLTDGRPNSRIRTEKEIDMLQKAGIPPIGLGIGNGTSMVSDLFPHGEGDISIEKLPEVLTKLIYNLIANPNLVTY